MIAVILLRLLSIRRTRYSHEIDGLYTILSYLFVFEATGCKWVACIWHTMWFSLCRKPLWRKTLWYCDGLHLWRMCIRKCTMTVFVTCVCQTRRM